MENQDSPNISTSSDAHDSNSNSAQTPTSKPVKKSKLIYVFFGMLVLLILTVSASAAVYISKSMHPKPSSTSSPSPAIQISPTPTRGSTANWKTFSDDKSGLSFKYPDNYSLETNSAQGLLVSLLSPIKKIPKSMDVQKTDLKVEVLSPKKTEKMLDEIINDEKVNERPDSHFEEKELIIGNQKGIHLTSQYSDAYYVLVNKYLWTIFKYPNMTNRQDEFDQILSTFKFTNANSLTENDIDEIKSSLAAHEKIAVGDIANFTSELYSDPTYASGNFSQTTPGSGAKWFAQKINDQWNIIYTGNGMPKCVDVAKYNAPKEFLSCF